MLKVIAFRETFPRFSTALFICTHCSSSCQNSPFTLLPYKFLTAFFVITLSVLISFIAL